MPQAFPDLDSAVKGKFPLFITLGYREAREQLQCGQGRDRGRHPVRQLSAGQMLTALTTDYFFSTAAGMGDLSSLARYQTQWRHV